MPAVNGRKMKRNPNVSDKNRRIDLPVYHSFARMIASLIESAAKTLCAIERRRLLFVNLRSTSVLLNAIAAKNVFKTIADATAADGVGAAYVEMPKRREVRETVQKEK